MSPLEFTRPSFSQSGKSIEDILFKGACGGSAAVRCYLETRRSMLLRDVPLGSSVDESIAPKLQIISTLGHAIELLSCIEGKPAAASEKEAASKATRDTK